MSADPTFLAPSRWATDRVVLRSWLPGEGGKLTEALSGSYGHLAPWMPWASREQPVEVSELRVRGFRARWLLGEDFVMPILSPDEGRVLGGTGFHPRQGTLANGNIEVGMWIRAEEAGRGLGRQVLRALVAWGWKEWPFRRMVWRCHVANGASRRTAEAAGFTLESIARQDTVEANGTVRDTCVYVLLKGDAGGGVAGDPAGASAGS